LFQMMATTLLFTARILALILLEVQLTVKQAQLIQPSMN